MENEYAVVIYFEYTIVELRFDNKPQALDYYNAQTNNIKHNGFTATIVELHNRKNGLIMRYVDNIDFYENNN